MHSILGETVTTKVGAAWIARFIFAVLLVLRLAEFAFSHFRRRNGNNRCCQGCGCERLAVVETRQDGFARWLERVEGKLDAVFERL